MTIVFPDEKAAKVVDRVLSLVENNPSMSNAGMALTAVCQLQSEIYKETSTYYYSPPPDTDNKSESGGKNVENRNNGND